MSTTAVDQRLRAVHGHQAQVEPATAVFDAATNAAWGRTETAGAPTPTTPPRSAARAASPPPARSPTPSTPMATARGGGPGLAAGLWRMTGVPPNSNTQGPLTAGSRSFRAVYRGDTDNVALDQRLRTVLCRSGVICKASRASSDYPGRRACHGLMGGRRRIILGSGVLVGGLVLVGIFVVTCHGSDRPFAKPIGEDLLPPAARSDGAPSSVGQVMAPC